MSRTDFLYALIDEMLVANINDDVKEEIISNAHRELKTLFGVN